MCRSFLFAAWVATAVLTSAQEPEPEIDCGSISYAFFPVEDDCSKFVFCNDGQAEEYSCRDDEYWSQQTGACVIGDPETCQEWSPELACGGNNTETILPHPRDCGKFVLCSEEGDTLHDCEVGLIFETDRCVVGNLEECESYEPMCDDKENQNLMHPDWCNAFIRCGTENVTLEFCPEGEIFSEDIRQCVLGDLETCAPLSFEEMCENRVNETLAHPDRCQSFVKCNEEEEPCVEDCPRGMIFNSRSLSCVVGNLDTCELLDQVCVNENVDGMLEHPSGCDMHIICLDEGVAQLRFCPFGRIWRQDMMMCVPGNQSSCERAPIESMCSDQPYGAVFPHPEGCSILVQCEITEATEIPCPVHHILQPGTLDCVLGDQKNCTSYNDLCVGKLYEIVAIPDTCDAYIFCRNEYSELHNCPPGEIFNANLGRCSPGDTEACEFLECTNGDSLSRHPNYCNIFTRCYNGQISTQFCPFEHIFHETMKRCTPGDVTGCEYDSLEEMCQGRFSDSVYPYPSTENQCKEYVLCTDDEAKVQSCPAGTVLRPEHLDCVPGDEQTCGIIDIVCLPGEESVIVHPDRCDVMIICSNGAISVNSCPPETIFDQQEGVCIPGNVETCLSVVNQCIDRPDGQYAYEPTDCSRFIICRDQRMTVETCPDREIFISSFGICFPGTVEVCATFPLDNMCEDRENGQIYPDLENCSQFVTCNENEATRTPCERGNIYSPSHRQCLAGSDCELIRSCETAADNTILLYPESCDLFIECRESLAHAKECPPEHIITTHSNGQCIPGNVELCIENQCLGRPDGQYELELPDCSRYIICLDEVMTVESCPDREIYLPHMGICFPGTVETCATYPVDTMCQDRENDSIYPDLDDCFRFIICNNNEATRTPCERGNIYSPSHRQCLAGGVGCQPFDLCLTEADETILPNPEDCVFFIRCESQLPKAEECPAGEILTANTAGLCVPGDSETCLPTQEDNNSMRRWNKIGKVFESIDQW